MRMNPLQQASLVLYAPIQRLDVEVVPLVGAGKEANAGGEGEGAHSSFDGLQLLRSWRRKHREEKHHFPGRNFRVRLFVTERFTF